jgi:2-keto-4-pentenoate hydratase/2-oxohepta-3-ene-1,7-dioic acid hydratase in catechol pathway
MKLARVQAEGRPTYGVVIPEGVLTKAQLEGLFQAPLPAHVEEFGTKLLSEPGYRDRVEAALRREPSRTTPLPVAGVRFLAPLAPRPKVICIGLNYRDHAEEQGVPPPREPLLFLKPHTAVTGPYDAVEYPGITTQVDYEGELGVVIGRNCRRVNSRDALGYVLGYTVFNDISARDLQFRDGQWARGKSFDTFAPVGPWIVTGDEIPDPQVLAITTWVNGEVRQQSNTANMIFSVAQLVDFVSAVMTLEPGDILATGTPAGVGIFTKPAPKLLHVGDVVEVEIAQVGRLRNQVVAAPPG